MKNCKQKVIQNAKSHQLSIDYDPIQYDEKLSNFTLFFVLCRWTENLNEARKNTKSSSYYNVHLNVRKLTKNREFCENDSLE